jgi:hypothetical protein
LGLKTYLTLLENLQQILVIKRAYFVSLQENLHIPTDTFSDGKLNRGYRYHKTVGIEFCGFCKLLSHEFCWYRILKISHVYPKNFFLLFFLWNWQLELVRFITWNRESRRLPTITSSIDAAVSHWIPPPSTVNLAAFSLWAVKHREEG